MDYDLAETKELRLLALIKGYGRALVAFSGGVDSTYLLAVTSQALGADALLAVTAISETYLPRERAAAAKMAAALDVPAYELLTSELAVSGFTANGVDRCYHCKRDLFTKLQELARLRGYAVVLDGCNLDDAADYRPGMKAGGELGVKSPLRECELSKDEIRWLSRERGLSTWNKPAMACLASRFPFGEEINAQKLQMVATGEEFILALGVSQVRVRHHGDTARIEVSKADFPRIIINLERVTALLHELGYRYVTLDLDGYRSGSLNP